MELVDAHNEKSVRWWISSLAIAIVCCAIQFIIFAGFMLEVRKNVDDVTRRLDALTLSQAQILKNVQDVRRHMTAPASVLPAANPAPEEHTEPTKP